MMRTFKIISSLAFIALAATANADGDCQNECENECHRFVTDVATGLECQVDDSHAGITKDHCKIHCKDFCTGTAVDCQKTCDDDWYSFATDVAEDLDCLVDSFRGSRNQLEKLISLCEGHCTHCDIFGSGNGGKGGKVGKGKGKGGNGA